MYRKTIVVSLVALLFLSSASALGANGDKAEVK